MQKELELWVYNNLDKLIDYLNNEICFLKSKGTELFDWQEEILSELREEYPDLSLLPDDNFLCEYDYYQSSWNQVSGYDVYRENEFIIYLICCLLNLEDEVADNFYYSKELVVYAFLQLRKSRNEALEFANKHFDKSQ